MLIFVASFITAWIMLEVLFKVSLSFANDRIFERNDNFLIYLRSFSLLLFISTFIFFLVNEEKFTNMILFICSI